MFYHQSSQNSFSCSHLNRKHNFPPSQATSLWYLYMVVSTCLEISEFEPKKAATQGTKHFLRRCHFHGGSSTAKTHTLIGHLQSKTKLDPAAVFWFGDRCAYRTSHPLSLSTCQQTRHRKIYVNKCTCFGEHLCTVSLPVHHCKTETKIILS